VPLDVVRLELHHGFALVEEVLVDCSPPEQPDVAVVGDRAVRQVDQV
jgi:hypothetical protein